MDADRLAKLASDALGTGLRHARPVSGGDLACVVRLDTLDGRVALAKTGPAPHTEAAMLVALAGAGVPVPAVLAVTDALLVLEWIDSDGGPQAAWGDLGRIVRRLHACTGTRYGWDQDSAFGAVHIDNRSCASWPAFWAERRLRPLLPALPTALARRVARLADDLDAWLPLRPPPALLHGDLWSGNVMARGNTVAALVDPACYHGHAEVDLAMLSLFATPGSDFHAAYGALESGAQARLPIYRLWPALVHLRLFGSVYLSLVDAQLRTLGL